DGGDDDADLGAELGALVALGALLVGLDLEVVGLGVLLGLGHVVLVAERQLAEALLLLGVGREQLGHGLGGAGDQVLDLGGVLGVLLARRGPLAAQGLVHPGDLGRLGRDRLEQLVVGLDHAVLHGLGLVDTEAVR